MSDKPAGESITPAVGGEEKENVKPTTEQPVPPASDPQVEAQPFDPTIGDTPKREVKSEENTSNGPTWIESAADSPLSQFCTALASIRETADYHEVYGLDISDSNSFHSKLILQKFLRANANDLEKAKGQLLETLRWRKQFQPLEQLKAAHDKARFGGFGYVTEIESVPGSVREGGKEIVTYNLYGAVKDKAKTFGDVERFLKWRVALMELSLQKLHLADATTPIPDYGKGPDPYQGIQIHDYLNVSFLRQDPAVKAASSKAIEVFSKYYPETLSRKFFVNVPLVMSWLYNAIKLVLPRETVRKFTVLNNGNQLAGELGPGVPAVYGGKGGSLEDIGEQVILDDAPAVEKDA